MWPSAILKKNPLFDHAQILQKKFKNARVVEKNSLLT